MGRYSYKGSQNLTNSQILHLYHGLEGVSTNMFGDIQTMRNAGYDRQVGNGRFSGYNQKRPGNLTASLAGVGFWFRK